jgi:hypothetical protein
VGFADKQTQLSTRDVDIHDVPKSRGFGCVTDIRIVDWCGKDDATA